MRRKRACVLRYRPTYCCCSPEWPSTEPSRRVATPYTITTTCVVKLQALPPVNLQRLRPRLQEKVWVELSLWRRFPVLMGASVSGSDDECIAELVEDTVRRFREEVAKGE